MKPWRWYVYIIECSDGTYYTGLTWNLDIRINQHQLGKGSAYSTKHGFKKLAYAEEFESFDEARHREKQIKDWNQSKKQKLISGKWGKWV